MQMPRWLFVIVTTIALGGCCLSSNGCYAPVPGVPTAWDGAGPAPQEGEGEGVAPASPKRARAARNKTEIIVGPIQGATTAPVPYSKEYWAQKDAESRNADAELSRQMTICRGCAPEK
jgi:hypothetical protein